MNKIEVKSLIGKNGESLGAYVDYGDFCKMQREYEEQIEKMKCCDNCKNCEINFTNDSGIKHWCKKLRHKSDDCILNYYYHWELA